MSKWQIFRLFVALLSECVGYLFIIWSAYLQYQNVTNNVEVPNVFGIWLDLMFGFFFLVIGILCARSIKKNISEKLLYWLTKPALILCIALFSLYLWLVFPYLM